MFDAKTVRIIVHAILIVSALNWGLVAYNGTDLVKVITKGGALERYAKFAIAIVGLYAGYNMYLWLTEEKVSNC